MRLFITIFLISILVVDAVGQSSNAPLNKDYYHLLDRLEIRSGNMAPAYHSAVKPYSRKAIAALVDSARDNTNFQSGADQFNFSYLANDNWQWTSNHTNENNKPIWNTLYRYRSNFLYGEDKNDALAIHVNPVLYLSVGGETASDNFTYINTRGVQVHGMIDGKVGYYTYIGENQMRTPLYVRDWRAKYGVVPNEGFYKGFGDGGYDFFTVAGYISFNVTRHINFQFGQDRQFWGDGYRSMVLSDFSPPALFLRINTNIWRLNYTNLFTQLVGDTYGQPIGSLGNAKYPKKYLVSHRLSYNLGKNINIGVFESIIFSRLDSLGNSHFELSYLNPIIFYRAIEHQGGSLDNALIGIDAKWNFLQHFSLYGQLFFDEIKVNELFNNPGWWGNKYAYQLGLKYIDAFKISNLDLQVERNYARPYTYTHGSINQYGFILSNYANYKQPLAHPIGANFKEWIGIIRYQPIPKLSLAGKIIAANYGLDEPDTNYGKEILKDYTTRESEQDNFTGQGIATDLLFADFTASYMLWHNTFIDAKVIYRNQDSADNVYDQKSTIYSISFRWNIAPRVQEF